MLNSILGIIRKGCNGLYLCEVLTGIGKSYQVSHAMEEYKKSVSMWTFYVTSFNFL